MNAKELIMSGTLSEARARLVADVKASPADPSHRTLLFQILAYLGEWDKARRHLELLASQNADRRPAIQVYLNLVQAENERLAVIRRKSAPAFLPEAPDYLALYETALQKIEDRQLAAAKTIFREIDTRRPAVSGTLNGRAFTGFQDTDTRLCCFLETFVHERYVLVPFEFIRELTLGPPKSFLDLLWASAQVTTWEGLALNCFLPVLYPETFLNSDDRLKRGKMTDWIDLGEKIHQGAGQHVFQVGREDIGILEIQQVNFDKDVRR